MNRFSKIVLSCVACFCLLGEYASAQLATVSVDAPASVVAGDQIDVVVQAATTSPAAVAAFAADAVVLDGSVAIESLDVVLGALDEGASTGIITTAGATGIIGGQSSDLGGLNPGIDLGPTAELFTLRIQTAPDSQGQQIQLLFTEHVVGAGLVVYPDASLSGSTDVAIAVLGLATIQVVSPCAPDTNGDGSLTPADFNAWILAFNNSEPACDQNSDDACTPADFNAWVLNYNVGC